MGSIAEIMERDKEVLPVLATATARRWATTIRNRATALSATVKAVFAARTVA